MEIECGSSSGGDPDDWRPLKVSVAFLLKQKWSIFGRSLSARRGLGMQQSVSNEFELVVSGAKRAKLQPSA